MAAVWVGAETGMLKGIDVNKKQFQNYGELSSLSKLDEICRMCWSDVDESQIFIGVKSGVIKTFDVTKQDYVQEKNCFKPEDGLIVGLEKQERCHSCVESNPTIKDLTKMRYKCGKSLFIRTLLTCCQSGVLRLLKDLDDEPTDIKVGNHIARMRQNPFQSCQVATGGEENALKLWDLNNPEQPIFKAKNVRNDQLDLRVPIFVKDMGFLSSPGSLPKIVVGTAYHKLRLYDLKAQKRPVMDISYKESPITCISVPSHERFIIIGNTYGDMAAIDIRNGKDLGSYKSFAGSIHDIQCHKSEPLVASCGLDRFLRIHHIDTRQLVDKIYLKSRLKCLLFSKDYTKESDQVNLKDLKSKRKIDKNGENQSSEESDGEEIWNEMDVVEDEAENHQPKKPKKKKKEIS